MPFQTTKRTILSVDDDEVNQIVITSFLEGAGYNVVQAMDGEECLDYLSKAFSEDLECKVEIPDLIFLDVVMPGMDGYKVCREIRRRFPASLPVIMISARMTKEDVIHGLTVGLANDYLTKPFDRVLMLAKIDSRIAISDAIKAHEAHLREDFCMEMLKPLLPIKKDVPIGLFSLDVHDQVPALIDKLMTMSQSGNIKVLNIQFGTGTITAGRYEDLLEACIKLGARCLCFVMSPDRDFFRMMRLHHDYRGSLLVRMTERFYNRLDASTRERFKSNDPTSTGSVVSEYGDVASRIAREVAFLEGLKSAGDSADLLIERHKFELIKEVLELESAIREIKSGIAFENSNLDAIEHRQARARTYRSDFASQLGLIDDL